MQKNRKRNIWYIVLFCLLVLIVVLAIWYFYELRLEAIDKEIETITSCVQE